MNPALADAIARAKAAVFRASLSMHSGDTATTFQAWKAAARPGRQLPATVRVRLPVRPQSPTSAELVAGLSLSAGAMKLWSFLHRLAVDLIAHRGHQVRPGALVFHLPTSLAAFAICYTDRHVRRLVVELEAAGLIHQAAHAARVGAVNLWDGSLWAVRLLPGAPPPRLRAEHYRHAWRNLADDLKARRTAHSLMSALQDTHTEPEGIYRACQAWVVEPGKLHNLRCSADMDVRDAVYALPALLEAHPAARSKLITQVATILATELRDTHSRPMYAWMLYRAIDAEHRGIRALTHLRHAFTRLLADVGDYTGLLRPEALLVNRLKVDGTWDALACP